MKIYSSIQASIFRSMLNRDEEMHGMSCIERDRKLNLKPAQSRKRIDSKRNAFFERNRSTTL